MVSTKGNVLDIHSTDYFFDGVFEVLNEGLLDWCSLSPSGFVYLNRSFKRVLFERMKINVSLSSLAEQLGWKYGSRRVGTSSKLLQLFLWDLWILWSFCTHH